VENQAKSKREQKENPAAEPESRKLEATQKKTPKELQGRRKPKRFCWSRLKAVCPTTEI